MTTRIHQAALLVSAICLGCAGQGGSTRGAPGATAPAVSPATQTKDAPCDHLDTDGRTALTTLERLGLIAGCQEAGPGVLRLQIGDKWKRAEAEYHLNHLFNGYSTHVEPEHPVVLELWKDGQKVGQYTIDGLLYGSEFTPRR
jgi:hypothetical protein